MKYGLAFAAVLWSSCLAGCSLFSSTQPVSSKVSTAATNSVAGAETALTAVDQAAVLYIRLPLCGAPNSPVLCSNASVSAKIKADAQAAYNVVKQVQAGTQTVQAAFQAIALVTTDIPVSGTLATAKPAQ
jgi:hypothetical protein